MKSKLTATIASFFVLISMATAIVFAAPQAHAADNLKCSVLPQSICNMAKNKSGNSSSDSAVLSLLEWVLAILTGGVGVVAVGMFAYAGILYSSSDGDSSQVKKAKDLMLNIVIGLTVFAAMAIAIEWLIPGGVF